MILCISCGFDESPILSPPEKGDTSEIGDYFQFRALERNGCSDCDHEEPDFRGFELYYKFFSVDAEGESALNLQSSFETINELETNGFRRISYYIDNNNCDKPTRVLKPLIPVPSENRGNRFLITIDFGDLADVHMRATDEEPGGLSTIRDEDELQIRRGIEDEDNEGFFKTFEDFKNTDLDVSGIESLDENRVYIVLYVLSCGKYNLAETIYSEALCLSENELIDLIIVE